MTIRIGFIGAGWMGSYLLGIASSTPDVEIAGVADVSEERLREVSSKYGVKRLFTDYRLLLDEEPDAVVVASPPRFHAEQAVESLRRGISVLLEKPMALSLAEARRIYEEAKRSSGRLMLAFSLRYHKMYMDIAEFIKDLGKPLNIWHMAYGRVPPAPWVRKRELSGGMINENGVHILYVLRWYAGEVDRVYARERTVQPGIDIEDVAAVLLEHGTGAVSNYVQCWCSTHHCRRWGMLFEHGAVTVDGYLGGTCTFSNDSGVKESRNYPEGIEDMYRREFNHFVKCVSEGLKPLTNEEDGIRVQAIVEAIHASAREGRPTPVSAP